MLSFISNKVLQLAASLIWIHFAPWMGRHVTCRKAWRYRAALLDARTSGMQAYNTLLSVTAAIRMTGKRKHLPSELHLWVSQILRENTIHRGKDLQTYEYLASNIQCHDALIFFKHRSMKYDILQIWNLAIWYKHFLVIDSFNYRHTSVTRGQVCCSEFPRIIVVLHRSGSESSARNILWR